jgi:histidinol-phosphate aminotransferase
MTNLDNLIRENIKTLKPYSSARSEYQGDAGVFLDANENPFNAPFNRYPDPLQRELKTQISEIKQVPAENIFLGNGSDEPIDLVVRAFCEPKQDNIVAIDPTYGMYRVAADINNVEYRSVKLEQDFTIDASKLLMAADLRTKLIFLCSPNNPTGNYLDELEIEKIIKSFSGLVILDEAYIDFSKNKGFASRLNEFPNLILLHTFSKAWGLASIRLGMAFASKPIIAIFNKIKYPYNINILTQKFALEALKKTKDKADWVECIVKNRALLEEELEIVKSVQKVYRSDANFLLVKVENPEMMYNYLVDNKVIVRNRSNVTLCAGCLRITVGSQEENDALIRIMRRY